MTPERTRRRNGAADGAGVDLRRLRYFLAVCRHGGFSRAAAAIGVAQPALTRQIKLLEEEIGQTLIERSRSGARPSEQGRFLIARSREHLDGLDGALRDLRQTFAVSKCAVMLGVCPSVAPLFLDDLVAHIGARHPNLSLSVIQAYSGDLRRLMQAGRIDVALTYRADLGAGFACADLLSERFALVSGASRRRPEAPARLADLADMKLILPSRIHALRGIIDRVCCARGIELAPDLELDSLDAVKTILLDEPGDRRTILPFHCVQADVAAGVLCASEFADPGMQRTIAVVTPKSPRDAEAVARIAARVRQRARALKRKLRTVF